MSEFSCSMPSGRPPENSVLYRPVDPNDSEIKALASSIAENGILTPLVVTADGYILSGHRRHAAARLAGLLEVPCRVDPIRRNTDRDGFVRLLREYNRQRVKTFDEVVREEVVSMDPEEAYQSLLTERRQRAEIPNAAIMDVGDEKVRASISRAKAPMMAAVKHVLSARRQLLAIVRPPYTLRAVERSATRSREQGQALPQ